MSGDVSNRTIGTAIGILMTSHHLPAAAAFRLLVTASQHTNRKLRDIADDLTTTGQLPLNPALTDQLLTRLTTRAAPPAGSGDVNGRVIKA